jgi:hypothetical protein
MTRPRSSWRSSSAWSRTADRPAVRAGLHRAAQALQRAFGAGASMDAVLAHLITATAPPAPLPPFEPWRSLLLMSFEAFAEAGIGLHVRLPALGEAIWLVSGEGVQKAVVRETRLWDRYIKTPPWMALEADRLRPPGGRAHGGPVHRGPRREGHRLARPGGPVMAPHPEIDRKRSSGRENEMTTPKEDAPATPATRPPDRFEQEVHEKGYLDEADVT